MMRSVITPFDATDDGDGVPIDVGAVRELCRDVLPAHFRHLSACCALLTVAAGPLHAQWRAPVDGGRTISLGQPRSWSWTAGASTGTIAGGSESREIPEVRLSGFHAIGNPVVGALGLQLEAYAGARSGDPDVGVRARLLFPFARVGVGIDLNANDGGARTLYTLMWPGRRGGFFRDGTVARFDFVPARGNSLSAALEVPIYREVPTGRTRPASDRARIRGPRATPAPPLGGLLGVNEALAEVRDAAQRIRVLAVPFLGREAPPTGAAARSGAVQSATAVLPAHLAVMREAMRGDVTSGGTSGAAGPRAARTIESETRRYHDALDRAFSAAIDGSTMAPGTLSTASGRRVGDRARQILLKEVLLPYDRLLGQSRDHDTILRFGHVAQGVFVRWLHAEDDLSGARAVNALAVFSALLEILEADRARISKTWRDARFAWMPLQYALRPEQHDTQEELDALVAEAVDERFTDGNFVWYVINEQFQYQLSRTILDARDYHVLVTHDFRGIDDAGHIDTVAFEQIVYSYLRAMTDRVKAYDTSGTFPTYLILHDQWYYSLRRGALFLQLLEDPTRHQVRLPRAFRAWEERIAAAQVELRAAIAGSSLLQAQTRQFGDKWLRNLVKVHVNVTNRPDQTFASWRLVPGLPVSDNILRDHRKLAFYDISEEDPYRGRALYTGAGVGEHYADGTWEDRSLLVRGPALLGLKGAVRDLLRGHGIAPERIPYALQPREKSPVYEDSVQRMSARYELAARAAVGVHNGSGYASKRVNVAKAVIYTLMPSGSVIMVPDSFWASEFWGAALFGASLRGARVLVIAPSNASNSVDFFGTQLLTRELMSRLLVARAALAPELEATGGQMRVGLFDSSLPVNDITGKVQAVRSTFKATRWLRELFGFPQKVYDDLDALSERRRIATAARSAPTETAAPIQARQARQARQTTQTKLHLKANFFASREAWTLMSIPHWGEMTESFVDARMAQVALGLTVRPGDDPLEPLDDIGGDAVDKWYDALPIEVRSRVMFYTIMGSQNQNFRSMVTDAEDALIVAKWPSVIPYLDAIALVGQSKWVESQAEIDALIPRVHAIQAFIAHWGRLVF